MHSENFTHLLSYALLVDRGEDKTVPLLCFPENMDADIICAVWCVEVEVDAI